MIGTAACAPPSPLDAPQPMYDTHSRQLLRLDWDANRDGRIEHRTYFLAGTAVRTEIDADGDDRIDRWEYVDAGAAPSHVGASSANDGIEDTWTWDPGTSDAVRIDRAQYRDGVIDRREFVQNDVLVRAEEDANRDGLVDKWETWSQGVLQVAAYDSTFATGRPDRRLVYESGRFAYLEADATGNGQFVRLASNPPGIRREDP
jgi:hypothetical protein